jgi:O-antigen/teichoic acid export membrane protein
LIGIDVIMARRLLIPEHAGYFAALSTLGRITIYISGAVAVVLFPRLVRQLKQESHASPAKILLPGLLLSLAISVLVPGVFALFPKLIINVLYGSRYPGLESILWVYAMALLPVVAVRIVSQYFLATRALAFPVLVGLAIAVKVVLLSLFHDSLLRMIFVVGIVNLSIAIILLVLIVFASSPGEEKVSASVES